MAQDRATRALKRDATRLRRLLQDFGREDGRVLNGVKRALREGADSLEFAIVENLQNVGAVDTGDLVESVAKVRRSSGLQWRVGFFRSGAVRKWRRAGWRAHFIEFGTKYPNQPAHRPVLRAREREVPHIVRNVGRAVQNALRRAARRNRMRGGQGGQ